MGKDFLQELGRRPLFGVRQEIAVDLLNELG